MESNHRPQHYQCKWRPGQNRAFTCRSGSEGLYRYDLDAVVSCVAVPSWYYHAKECRLATLLGVDPVDELLEACGGFIGVGDTELHFESAPTCSVVDHDVDLADVVPIVEDAGADVLGVDAKVAYDEALEKKPEVVEVP